MSLKHMKPLPPHPPQALFTASLARDVRNSAEALDGNAAVLRLAADRLHGMPRVADFDEIDRIAKELNGAMTEIEREQRRLRAAHDELGDFIR
jgi:hypothetical protein